MGYTTAVLATLRRSRQIDHHSCLRVSSFVHSRGPCTTRSFHSCPRNCQQHKHPAAHTLDPRLSQFGRVIRDEHSIIRDDYGQSYVYA